MSSAPHKPGSGVMLRAKCIVAGDAAVGKTSLIHVFHGEGTPSKGYSMTLGVTTLQQVVRVPDSEDVVEVCTVDSSGHELYSDHIQQHWTHPNMLFLVYDVTNRETFDSCNKWLECIRSHPPDQPYPGVLVANKTDLEKRRVISEEEGRAFATAKRLEYFEASSKITESCTSPFLHLVTEYHKLYEKKLEMMTSLI
ncbi:intraflagellar transport protein 27 homolog [Corticium candelabrum]|uniref:intraflagellar transport protein 27 homolog n=1 Tax=Corticium candelabrum TaxID=121492 RepID=UPI002E2FF4EC|nr:intraflagellar transport protein 27 homolog [Corticium candelabrum]